MKGDRFSPQARFGVLCLLGYVALSWSARFDMRRGEQIASLVYPLDTFSMYSRVWNRRISHMLVRDSGGEVHRVISFRTFDCDSTIATSDSRCAKESAIAYHDDDLIHFIQGHAGAGGEPVELIRRTWNLREGATPALLEDCVITTCRVAR